MIQRHTGIMPKHSPPFSTSLSMQWINIFIAVLLFSACRQDTDNTGTGTTLAFGQPVPVSITGYTGHSMEPFISPDGNTLFFNNLNAAPENTNLHWATRINDSSFQYQGEITGVNSAELDGVPTMDQAGNFYFVSIRSYTTSLSTLYQCNYAGGAVANVQLVNGISLQQPGWLIFDAAVSTNGQTLYIADGRFDNTGIPLEADLSVAGKTANGFQRLTNSAALLNSINTPALEYAACISNDQLEIYFTRLALPVTPQSTPQILIASRKSVLEPFGPPEVISSITGFAEAATLAPDQKTVYYHKKENDRFVLYKVSRR